VAVELEKAAAVDYTSLQHPSLQPVLPLFQ